MLPGMCTVKVHDLFCNALNISDFVCCLFNGPLSGNSMIISCLIIQISPKCTKYYEDMRTLI